MSDNTEVSSRVACQGVAFPGSHTVGCLQEEKAKERRLVREIALSKRTMWWQVCRACWTVGVGGQQVPGNRQRQERHRARSREATVRLGESRSELREANAPRMPSKDGIATTVSREERAPAGKRKASTTASYCTKLQVLGAVVFYADFRTVLRSARASAYWSIGRSSGMLSATGRNGHRTVPRNRSKTVCNCAQTH